MEAAVGVSSFKNILIFVINRVNSFRSQCAVMEFDTQ